ncbi:MAG TPA: nitrogenase component 1 [Bacteroidales bacterium]|nr:nitrogenase component 1 [Bacteroidales bacterium]
MKKTEEKPFTATRNACKVCSPLGASIAFKGVAGCVPLIHGSQGCATYIRRYLISHFKEPVDIASTNFTEESAIFGGEKNLFSALRNVTSQYKPELIGIATTCLSETIGDDMNKLVKKYAEEATGINDRPGLCYVNTPSFSGTHMDGFHNAVCALVKRFAESSGITDSINFFPGLLSPQDIRHFKEILQDFGLSAIIAPDYSDTLDYGYTGKYEKIPEGGVTIGELKATGSARASVELGYILNRAGNNPESAAEFLERTFCVPRINSGIPIGINENDALMEVLKDLSGCDIPVKYVRQRERLIDSYIDGHKYLFGKKAVVYGEEDFVIAIVSFLEEIGIETVLCATGGKSGYMKETIESKTGHQKDIPVHDNFDFEDIDNTCSGLKPDLLIGNSKGYYIARKYSIPLVRVGFPIHDRIGGQHLKHVGYEGTQELFDRITNALIEYKQDNSPVGYKYM